MCKLGIWQRSKLRKTHTTLFAFSLAFVTIVILMFVSTARPVVSAANVDKDVPCSTVIPTFNPYRDTQTSSITGSVPCKTETATRTLTPTLYKQPSALPEQTPAQPVSDPMDFAKNQIVYQDSDDLKSINSDGGNKQTISVNFSGTFDDGLTPRDWSPDGKYLLASRGSQIWIVDYFNRTSYRRLFSSRTFTNVYHARWSPDGRFIVVRVDESGTFKTYAVRPDGTAETSLGLNVLGFDFSPDGTKFASGNSNFQLCGLYLYNVGTNGSGGMTISPFASNPSNDRYFACPTGTDNGLFNVVWSPDGHSIAMTTSNSRQHFIYDVATTSHIGPLDTQGMISTQLAINGWRPDGKALLFIGIENSSHAAMYVYTVATSTYTTILEGFTNTAGAPRLAIWRRALNTVGVYRPNTTNNTGVFLLRNSLTTGAEDLTIPYNFGNAASNYPIMGDWNGDGVDKVGVYDSSTGIFYLSNSNVPGIANADFVFVLGNPADTPISGYWLANAPYEGVGVFRPSNGILYLKNELATGYADNFAILGNPSDVGIAGDWDGNGQDSPGVYRPMNNTWYLSNNSAPSGITYSDLTWQLDSVYSAPVTGDWVGLGRNYGGMNNSGGVADSISADPAPLQFILFDSTLTNSPGRYLPVFGNTNDKPVVGSFMTQIAMQGIPTNTKRPTRTPVPSTATQTATPTPTQITCPVTINGNTNFRNQSAILNDPNSGNTLFTMQANGTITQPVPSNRAYLWPNGVTPAHPDVYSGLNAVAYVGIVNWISTTAEWYQVTVTVSKTGGTEPVVVRGYIADTGTNLSVSCTGSLPLPAPSLSFPTQVPQEFNVSPIQPIFGGNSVGMPAVPSSYAGAFSYHAPGTTFDVVPLNLELCLDTADPSNLASCDQSGNIPVYAPVSGTYTYFAGSNTAVIMIDATPPPGFTAMRAVALTHIKNARTTAGSVAAGDKIGDLCKKDDQTASCGIANTVQTHLAFQLGYRTAPGASPTPLASGTEARNVLGILDGIVCIYDEWNNTPGASPVFSGATSPFRACR